MADDKNKKGRRQQNRKKTLIQRTNEINIFPWDFSGSSLKIWNYKNMNLWKYEIMKIWNYESIELWKFENMRLYAISWRFNKL